MMKLIFYRVSYNKNNVSNFLKWRGKQIIERAKIKKLFECYCVNQFQIDKIMKYLSDDLLNRTQGNEIFKISYGYKIFGSGSMIVNYSLFATDDGEYFTGSASIGDGAYTIDEFAEFLGGELTEALKTLLRDNPSKVFSLVIDSSVYEA